MTTLSKPTDDKFLINRLLNGWVAFTPDAGIYLWRSAGRRQAGSNTRYTLHIPDFDKSPHFTAASDEEALQKANAWLAKHNL